MTSLLNYFSSSSKNRGGRIGITDILIPDSDSDGDSGATGALPDGYYSVNKYSAAVLVTILRPSISKLNDY